jgi:hypothetical protein
VQRYTERAEAVGGPMVVSNEGEVLDVVATDWGFAVLNKSGNKLQLIGCFENGRQKFKTVICDNGDNPTKPRNQLTFGDKPDFGYNCIFKPNSGRLGYGKGRIAVQFAHYNHFGMKNGKRDDHTGDAFLTFNEDGKDAKMAYAWGTSHSIEQKLIYDGDKFYNISLGDAFPQNSHISYVYPNIGKKDRLEFKKVKVHDVDVPGNGGGNCSGRIGGIVRLGGNTLAIGYSRTKCKF